MSKKYTTAMGKSIDMAALRTKNEKTRAVGNMNVNARGDTIDSHNRVINDNNSRVNSMYQKILRDKAVTPVTEKKTSKEKSKISKTELSDKELGFDEFDEPNPEKK